MKNNHSQTGISLIEIMIALLIGAFLIGGVLQIFIGSKQTYRMQENLSRLQENGRFAMDFLAKDIRMAGYRACLTFTSPSPDPVPWPINGTNDAGLNASDTIIIQMSTSNCSFPLTSTTVLTITYSIKAGASGQPALFKNDGITTRELVEGIENMQILYGVDIDSDGTLGYGTPNYYVPASSVTNKVVSIRLSLLAATLDDNLTIQPQPYTFKGTTTTPTDRKIRRVFTSTIALRNRLP